MLCNGIVLDRVDINCAKKHSAMHFMYPLFYKLNTENYRREFNSLKVSALASDSES